ncbi:hypothetical protein HDV00_008777 [Rhizophlyctis rosea]|nr:hypothetical protein HDV00_008777 [Rhizophlyctis rosea]
MNDPHIQAFDILSDRVSNLEEGINLLISNAKHRELRAYGALDSSLWGIRCPMWRSNGDTRATETHRQDYAASAEVDSIIVTLEGCDWAGDVCFPISCPASNVQFCHAKYGQSEDWLIDRAAFFTDAERRRIATDRAQLDDMGIEECASSRGAGLSSTQLFVCEEAAVRFLALKKAHFPTLAQSVIQPMFGFDLGTFAIALDSPHPVDVVVRDILGLITICGGKGIKHVDLYDCSAHQLEVYRAYCQWSYGGDEAALRVEIADLRSGRQGQQGELPVPAGARGERKRKKQGAADSSPEETCDQSVCAEIKRENAALREDMAAVKTEMQTMQATLSRFVTSERKEKYYQAILEEEFKAGHLRIEGIGDSRYAARGAGGSHHRGRGLHAMRRARRAPGTAGSIT